MKLPPDPMKLSGALMRITPGHIYVCQSEALGWPHLLAFRRQGDKLQMLEFALELEQTFVSATETHPWDAPNMLRQSPQDYHVLAGDVPPEALQEVARGFEDLSTLSSWTKSWSTKRDPHGCVCSQYSDKKFVPKLVAIPAALQALVQPIKERPRTPGCPPLTIDHRQQPWALTELQPGSFAHRVADATEVQREASLHIVDVDF